MSERSIRKVTMSIQLNDQLHSIEVKRKLRVAAYCRVSTDHEEQESSYETQCRHYTQYIQKNSDWELAGIFADEGISGVNTKKRERFNAMISECEAHNIEISLRKWIQTHYCEHPQKPLEIRRFAAVA